MENHYRVFVGAAEPPSGRLTALTVQGTDN